MPAEEVLDEGSIATPAGGATDEDIDALLASFSAARERAQAEEGARTVVMRVPEWLTQDTAHAGAERSNLVGALLESIDVPWTERTQSIYVRHLPARTIGFTYGAGSRGQAGAATPVPFVYVEFFTALVLEALGIPRDSFTNIFAIGRMAGWTAHVLEQEKLGRLIRPQSRYVGPMPGVQTLAV